MPGERGFFKYDHVSGQMVPVESLKPKRQEVNAPNIQTDEIEPTESWATDEGKIFTSRAKLDAHYKEHGYVRTGGEHLKSAQERLEASCPVPSTAEIERRRREIREDAEKAYYDIKYDRVPISEKEKQLVKNEERQWESFRRRREM